MRSNIPSIGNILAITFMLVASALAQTPTFQPLMTGHRVTVAKYVDGSVYGGLPKGGVVEYDTGSNTVVRSLTRADGLGGHFVTAMAWSGESLWIATSDGGLTAITDPGGDAETMQRYSSLLPSLNVTAVCGLVVGSTERVYYGTEGNGIGEIVGGLPGAYFDTLNGLIDDTVTDMAMTEDIVLIATPVGISRFGDNTFSNYPYDDPELDAPEDLELGPDGWIWAATRTGIHRWNDETRAWEHVFGTGHYTDLEVDGDTVRALTWNGVLDLVDGSGVTDPLPPPPAGLQFVPYAVAAGDGAVWVGGMVRDPLMVPLGSRAARPVVTPIGQSGTVVRGFDACELGVAGGFDGVAMDSRNRPWLGGREGDGLASFDGTEWYNVVDLASTANDSAGLINFSGGLLTMSRDGDAIWFNQYVAGLIRFVPAEEPGGPEDWLLLTPGNSPLEGDSHLSSAVHPDGVVMFGTSNDNFGGIPNEDLGVDILFDQTRPRDPASWLHIYPTTLGGNTVAAIGVERRDVIWFAVRSVGLRRWDVNGLGAGPDEPITWADTSDDHWAAPLETLPGSTLALDQANAIVTGPDGTLWVGGTGLVHFTYQPILELATPLGEWTRKESALESGLLGQTVSGLGFDHNGALWVLSEGGLNRMRFLEDSTVIDAFTDLGTFLTYDSSFYAPSAISALPGGTYRRLDMAADGRRLVISSDLGGAMVQIPEAGTEPGPEDLGEAYLYPNPFPGEGQDAYLSVGGLAIDEEAPVSLEILNLVGQIVYRSSDLGSGERIWDGLNRQGNRVASGLYVVKLNQSGQTTVRTLAVAY